MASTTTTPATTVQLLEDVAGIMTARATRLAGVERSHTASVSDPAWLIVVDEMAVLTAYLPDRELRTRAVRALSLLLTQGRAVGVTVWAFLQDPSKDVLSLRDLFTQRVCLRMTEPTGAAMVLGDAARDTAPAHRISPDTPGTGYARTESGTVQRVRATYVTDEQIRYLAANFPAPTSTVLDGTVHDGQWWTAPLWTARFCMEPLLRCGTPRTSTGRARPGRHARHGRRGSHALLVHRGRLGLPDPTRPNRRPRHDRP